MKAILPLAACLAGTLALTTAVAQQQGAPHGKPPVLPPPPKLPPEAFRAPGSTAPGALPGEPPAKPGRRPIVVMEQTRLRGKVIYLPSEMHDEEPAANVPVAIFKPDVRDPLFQTNTDKNGIFQIPQLGPDTYRIRVGQLMLHLEVIPKQDFAAEQHEQPKILLIVIPRTLG